MMTPSCMWTRPVPLTRYGQRYQASDAGRRTTAVAGTDEGFGSGTLGVEARHRYAELGSRQRQRGAGGTGRVAAQHAVMAGAVVLVERMAVLVRRQTGLHRPHHHGQQQHQAAAEGGGATQRMGGGGGHATDITPGPARWTPRARPGSLPRVPAG